jgi:hypothetical protein
VPFDERAVVPVNARSRALGNIVVKIFAARRLPHKQPQNVERFKPPVRRAHKDALLVPQSKTGQARPASESFAGWYHGKRETDQATKY